MTSADIKKPHHIIVLIGLPAAGKSTFVTNFLKTHPDYVVISSDDILERIAIETGIDYNRAFLEYREDAESEYSINLSKAINERLNIIVDRTNQTVKARRKILSRVPKTYKKTAIVFSLPREEINQRLLARELRTGKSIPQKAIDDMVSIYRPPTTSEGFDEVINN